jgi:uncharacterized protein (UPF0332 family)
VRFLISLKECYEKGLLKKTSSSVGLAIKGLNQADFFLAESRDLINLNKLEMCVIALYNAYFHAARSLLFRDGIRERSHYCVSLYVEDVYVNRNILESGYLDNLNAIRDLRHEAQYSVNEIIIDEDIKSMISACSELIGKVRSIIQEKGK